MITTPRRNSTLSALCFRVWRPRSFLLAATALVATVILCACGTPESFDGDSDPRAESLGGNPAGVLTIGSQDYYSNEIVAEIYAQALEGAGYEVVRDFRIGQREVYMPELVAGRIDVFPDYSGNLLQYLEPNATQRASDEVYRALVAATPEGLRVLEQADASDQDSYVVTKDFAARHGVRSLSDLAKVDGLVLGGNSELETRPYGPKGLKSVYGADVSFTPIEDSGGALSIKALRNGQVQLVDIYSADPVLISEDLVVLEDPKGLLLASHVVPLVSARVDEEAVRVINAVSAALDAEDLRAMNKQSVGQGAPASLIATQWLAAKKPV